MVKTDKKKVPAAAKKVAGQAATELAVFGAILIFILGSIVRTAVGNSYQQNQNFKAMRQAMLSSWKASEKAQGLGAAANTSRNSASVLFVEDRLSPDFDKYGALDRDPYIASGSGTFTYELLYPLDVSEVASNSPIEDVWINGQHFPFTTATFASQTIIRPTSCTFTAGSCLQNQCLRNQREWVGGVITEGQLIQGALSSDDANNIFNELVHEGLLILVAGTTDQGYVTSAVTAGATTLGTTFTNWYNSNESAKLSALPNVVQALTGNASAYKLFYSMAVNDGTSTFPPSFSCATHPCKDNELSPDLVLKDANGNSHPNSGGDMLFDLQRLGIYDDTNPSFVTAASGMRPYMAWGWSATAGTVGGGDTTDGANPMIGLDPDNNSYPSYDIDGRLKPVTIYAMSMNSDGTANVSYQDFQNGDIDNTWDSNSCGPKPGLQNEAQIYTFTSPNCANGTACPANGVCPEGNSCGGTYLLINEGKLYNPETGQVVRSVNKRDSIDLIQRKIQLSANTGNFCNGATPTATTYDGSANPVEVCVAPQSKDANGNLINCFNSQTNIKSTCLDENNMMLYVRSRVEDRRGSFWLTNANGQLQVK